MRASSFQPHLMVLDIGLPDGDGFNVVDWLRQHEDLSRAAAGGLFWTRAGGRPSACNWSSGRLIS